MGSKEEPLKANEARLQNSSHPVQQPVAICTPDNIPVQTEELKTVHHPDKLNKKYAQTYPNNNAQDQG